MLLPGYQRRRKMISFKPSLEVEAVSDAIVKSDLTDMADIMMDIMKDIKKEK